VLALTLGPRLTHRCCSLPVVREQGKLEVGMASGEGTCGDGQVRHPGLNMACVRYYCGHWSPSGLRIDSSTYLVPEAMAFMVLTILTTLPLVR
jgi:hypothetical protein